MALRAAHPSSSRKRCVSDAPAGPWGPRAALTLAVAVARLPRVLRAAVDVSSRLRAPRCQRKPRGGRRCLSRPLRPRLGSLQFRRSGIPSPPPPAPPPRTHLTLLLPGGAHEQEEAPARGELARSPPGFPSAPASSTEPCASSRKMLLRRADRSLQPLDRPPAARAHLPPGFLAHRSWGGAGGGRCLWQGFCGGFPWSVWRFRPAPGRGRMGEARPVGPQPPLVPLRCSAVTLPGDLVLSEVNGTPSQQSPGGPVRARGDGGTRVASPPSCPFCPFTTVSAALVSHQGNRLRELNTAIADPRRVLRPHYPPGEASPAGAGVEAVNYTPSGTAAPGENSPPPGDRAHPRTHDTHDTHVCHRRAHARMTRTGTHVRRRRAHARIVFTHRRDA